MADAARPTAGPSKWIVACAAMLCLTGYILVYATGKAATPIRSDGFSYYVYLPSWFIFHDGTLAAVARDGAVEPHR